MLFRSLATLTEEHPDRFEFEMAHENLGEAACYLEPPGFPEPEGAEVN